MPMFRTITVAITAIAAAALLACGLPAQASAAGRPTVSLRASAVRIDAGTRPSFAYSVTGLPKGATVVLQRQVGTKKVWKTIARHQGRRGTIVAPKLAIGTSLYRAAVTEKGHVVATSPARRVYAYGDVPLSVLCPTCEGGVIDTGSSTFTYAMDLTASALYKPFPTYFDKWSLNGRSSCRSIDLQFAADDEGQRQGITSYVKILQGAVNAVTASADASQIGTATTRLDGGPLTIEVASSAPDLGYGVIGVALGGTLSCYTPNGRP